MLLLKWGSLTGAVNRLYYAAFYGARALLATREVDSSRHSGIIRLFQGHFVNSGMVDEDVAKALPRAFERRLDSNYEDFAPITREEVESLKDAVLLFIDKGAEQYAGGIAKKFLKI